jgi:hypothetical protein
MTQSPSSRTEVTAMALDCNAIGDDMPLPDQIALLDHLALPAQEGRRCKRLANGMGHRPLLCYLRKLAWGSRWGRGRKPLAAECRPVEPRTTYASGGAHQRPRPRFSSSPLRAAPPPARRGFEYPVGCWTDNRAATPSMRCWINAEAIGVMQLMSDVRRPRWRYDVSLTRGCSR